jgi:ribulose 1,5-bisphosphate synthetase/thiazole synthase
MFACSRPVRQSEMHMLRGMIHVSADVMGSVNEYDVVVVGAGQAGLCPGSTQHERRDRLRYAVEACQ